MTDVAWPWLLPTVIWSDDRDEASVEVTHETLDEDAALRRLWQVDATQDAVYRVTGRRFYQQASVDKWHEARSQTKGRLQFWEVTVDRALGPPPPFLPADVRWRPWSPRLGEWL